MHPAPSATHSKREIRFLLAVNLVEISIGILVGRTCWWTSFNGREQRTKNHKNLDLDIGFWLLKVQKSKNERVRVSRYMLFDLHLNLLVLPLGDLSRRPHPSP